MNVLFHNIYDEINRNNTLFEKQNVSIGDNLLKPFNLIPNEASKYDITVGTYSKIKLIDVDLFVFIDYPSPNDKIFKYATEQNKKMFLISCESPIISKEVINSELHHQFLKVFTWSDDLIKSNPDKYIKLNYLHDINANFEVSKKRNKKFVLIAGNKTNSTKNELYSLRYKCIKWFEKHQPESLDLYGIGWNLKAFDDKYYVGKLLNHYNRKFSFIKNKITIFKGKVNRKYDVLKDYNFSICFENVYGYNGYITEKIFDCLLSGTIPIYKGAPNIKEYIPENCFLDFNSFSSFKEMFDKIDNMSEDEIAKYRENINLFLHSSKTDQFKATYLADILLKNMLIYK